MAYEIRGLRDDRVVSAKRRAFASAAAKAADMRLCGVRDVRVLDGRGREVDRDIWTRFHRERTHRRHVEFLRNLGWGFLMNPVVWALPFIVWYAPDALVTYWGVVLAFGVAPLLLASFLFYKAWKVARRRPS
ncbi:MAG: hypothetical protein H7X93_03225 [Sphingomonadaceae bacterium]|nr:hypothetical protein [Sphingomonadaceae bacterium]